MTGGSMSLRLLPLVAVALLLCIAPSAGADPPQRLTWEELPQLVGKHVSIPLYNGGGVGGQKIQSPGGGPLIDVFKTNEPVGHPQGSPPVPAATLHTVGTDGKAVQD